MPLRPIYKCTYTSASTKLVDYITLVKLILNLTGLTTKESVMNKLMLFVSNQAKKHYAKRHKQLSSQQLNIDDNVDDRVAELKLVDNELGKLLEEHNVVIKKNDLLSSPGHYEEKQWAADLSSTVVTHDAKQNQYIIYISSKIDTVYKLRVSLWHEMGHIVHDDLRKGSVTRYDECRADEYAATHLGSGEDVYDMLIGLTIETARKGLWLHVPNLWGRSQLAMRYT